MERLLWTQFIHTSTTLNFIYLVKLLATCCRTIISTMASASGKGSNSFRDQLTSALDSTIVLIFGSQKKSIKTSCAGTTSPYSIATPLDGCSGCHLDDSHISHISDSFGSLSG